MFLQNLRAKVGARLNGDGEAGFTLIELLVVMLILGILAAIALPAFFNQKEKAGDAKAKEYVHTGQVAMETCATDNNNSYANCDQEALHEIEPTIPAAPGEEETSSWEVTTTASTYKIEVTSSGGEENVFWVERGEGGVLTYECESAGSGGCPGSGGGIGNWS